jgi:hypothetical protein
MFLFFFKVGHFLIMVRMTWLKRWHGCFFFFQDLTRRFQHFFSKKLYIMNPP